MTPTLSLPRHQHGQSLVMHVGVKVEGKRHSGVPSGAGAGEVKALIYPEHLFVY